MPLGFNLCQPLSDALVVRIHRQRFFEYFNCPGELILGPELIGLLHRVPDLALRLPAAHFPLELPP